MRRFLGCLVFSVTMGALLLGCDNAMDYNSDEGHKDRPATSELVPAIPLFGGYVQAVLPYLYREDPVADHNEQKPYFFHWEYYNRVKFTPESYDHELLTSTTKITSAWASLRKAGFDHVNAVLPITANEKENIAYFFSKDKYIKVKYEHDKGGDTLLSGPTKITDGWPTLKKAGFDRVDVAFPYFIGTGVGAYFFSGDSYIRIWIDGNLNDRLDEGPNKIADRWPVLREAGFDRVDAVLPINGYPDGIHYPWNCVYVFSGDRFLYMRFDPYGEQVLMSGPSKTIDHWPYLK